MISTADHYRTPLLDQVYHQAHSPHDRFYLPGHKGGRGSDARFIQAIGVKSLRADMPELPMLDQLFAPSGVIYEAQALAADAFGAEHTYFLVNGTSVGLMATVMTLCGLGEQIIVPRNCHQSIIHGLILSGAYPVWIDPEVDSETYLPLGLTPAQLQAAIEQFPNVNAAIAISPTYEGICGDIQGLATIAHQHNIPLIVDEAHGAHFCFHSDLPPSALAQGADLVVQSTHKTLGALTQASMLHTQGDRINQVKLQSTLTLLQSSSPNYLLLASLDAARHQMAIQGEQILDQAIALADDLQQHLKSLEKIRILERQKHPGFNAIDPLKLTLDLSQFPLSGFELDDQLSQNHQIWAELPTVQTLTFFLGQGNSAQDLDRLAQALEHFDTHPFPETESPQRLSPFSSRPPIMPELSPRQAFQAIAEPVKRTQALGRLSATTICPYPPGIPLIFPGETITEAALATLIKIQESGGTILGLPHQSLDMLNVIAL